MDFRLLDIVHPNASELSRTDQDMFRKIRRDSLGASDSSVVLGVNPFPDNTESELIRQKNAKQPTETELKIGTMINVRKGSDLEPIILRKFTEKWGCLPLLKPDPMYKFKEYPYLSVNFDGLMDEGRGYGIPVEAKFISAYGGRHYDFTKCVHPDGADPMPPVSHETNFGMYCKDMAAKAGIPVYYYTQIQQQMMATDADYAYLAGLFDKDWELHTWLVHKDVRVQQELVIRGFKLWEKVEKLRRA